MLLGIDGLEDTRLICGTIAAEKKDKQGKEGKVGETSFIFFCSLYFLLRFNSFFHQKNMLTAAFSCTFWVFSFRYVNLVQFTLVGETPVSGFLFYLQLFLFFFSLFFFKLHLFKKKIRNIGWCACSFSFILFVKWFYQVVMIKKKKQQELMI